MVRGFAPQAWGVDHFRARHSLPGSLHDDLTARRRWSDRSAESPALRGPARPVPAPVPTAPVPPLALDLVQFGEPLPAEPAEPAVREEGGKEQLPEAAWFQGAIPNYGGALEQAMVPLNKGYPQQSLSQKGHPQKET